MADPQTTTYRVLEELNLSNLEKHVMQHFAADREWRCAGGVCVVKDAKAFPNGYRYFQAMVKP